jgi:hypothetical protein
MLIANMGLFWKREDVFWGSQNNAGRLLGRLKTEKKTTPVDFWKQIGIYALYADYRLVYVGQVRSAKEGLGKRLKTHAKYDEHAGRWDAFSWFGVRFVKTTAKKNQDQLSDPAKNKPCPVDELLDILEGIAIEVAEPPLNSQGGRFTKNVEIYLQQRDTEKLGLAQTVAVDEILCRVDKICNKLKIK